MADKKSGEALGISGFTLGVVGFFVLLFNPFTSLILFIVGIIFCIMQQKNKKTRLGKAGLIINIIGIIVNIVYLIVLIKYLLPLIQEGIIKQNFPVS